MVKSKKRTNEDFASDKRGVVLRTISISKKFLRQCYADFFQEQLRDSTPFPYFHLLNFIDNKHGIVESIETELQEFPQWNRKENDLYSLYQTADFKNINIRDHPMIFSFRQFLYTVVRPWLEKTSGVNLIDQIDITGSCYSRTDGLLPHNDHIDTRRFAFVYYLTDEHWEEQDGGYLQLYDSDKDNQPTTLVTRLRPERNSLLLFEVTHKSWHSVQEIFSRDKPRLSINGWFHSARLLPEKVPIVEVIPRRKPSKNGKSTAKLKLFSNSYLQSEKQEEIRKVFGEKSEVLLKDFIQTKLHSTIVSQLDECNFKEKGPANKRRIFRLLPNSIEDKTELKQLYDFLHTTAATSLFSELTECDIRDSEVSVTVSRIEAGCYTTIGDEDADQAERDGYCLDAHIFLGNGEAWPEEGGGSIFYVARNDEEELIRVSPEPNSVALVFKEPEVFSFFKYANCTVPQPFYVVTVSYYHVVVEDENSEDNS